MPVELKKTNRTIEAHAERLAQELNAGLKNGMDFTRLQELFVHSIITGTRSTAKRHHFERLDKDDSVKIQAKKIQDTHNGLVGLATKSSGLFTTLVATGCAFVATGHEANLNHFTKTVELIGKGLKYINSNSDDLDATTVVKFLSEGSKNLEAGGKVITAFSEVFTSKEAGVRGLLETEMRSLHTIRDQLNSSEQQERQRIETLLRKLDELLRQQQEAKKG